MLPPSVCNPCVFHMFSPLEPSLLPGAYASSSEIFKSASVSGSSSRAGVLLVVVALNKIKTLSFCFLLSGTWIHEVDKGQKPHSLRRFVWAVVTCFAVRVYHYCFISLLRCSSRCCMNAFAYECTWKSLFWTEQQKVGNLFSRSKGLCKPSHLFVCPWISSGIIFLCRVTHYCVSHFKRLSNQNYIIPFKTANMPLWNEANISLAVNPFWRTHARSLISPRAGFHLPTVQLQNQHEISQTACCEMYNLF